MNIINSNKSERNRTIDIAKGIGILLIMWGHSGNWGIIGNILYIVNTFHVPLFFFLSALFLSSSQKFSKFIAGKSLRLLKPYVIYGLIALVVYALVTPIDMYGHSLIDQTTRFAFGMRADGYIFSGALWFLTALFASLVVCFLIIKIFPNRYFQWSLLLIVLGMFFNHYNIILPLNADISILMAPIMLGAYKYREKILTHKFSLKISIVAFISICIYLILIRTLHMSSINYYSNTLGIVPFTLIAAVLGIYIVLWISQIIAETRKSERLKKYLILLGENSIILLVVHQTLIMHPINVMVSKNNIIGGGNLLQLKGLICFIVMLAVAFPAIYVINKFLPKTIR